MTSGLNLIFPLFFGLVGLGLVVLILKLVVSAIFGDTSNLYDKFRLKTKEGVLAKADASLNAGDLDTTCALLRSAFYLEHVKGDPKFLDRVANHHLGILGRIVSIADRNTTHIENLPVVEDLLLSRIQLMRSFIEKRRARKKDSAERSRETPEWAMREFDRQLDEIKDKLEVNRRSIESQLGKLFAGLRAGRKGDEVTYH